MQATSVHSRRDFLGKLAFTCAGCANLLPIRAAEFASGENMIMTVSGPIAPEALGETLTHEHCVVDFLGAEKHSSLRHDQEEAVQRILPHLQRVKARGCRSVVECTPNYIGRAPRLLKRLAEQSGLNIVTNTGYYGAAANKFLPRHAFRETEAQLAARWLREWRDGIDDSGIRPGFIKLGVEKGPLSNLHAKLVRAAARVHLQSGLSIAIHTGDGTAALDELRVLADEGVGAGALIWVHAQNDPKTHIELARRGAWISLDGYSASEKNRARYLEYISALKQKNLLGRVLLSHDHFWSVEGDGRRGSLKLANGGPEPFTAVFTYLLPDLKKAGFSENDIKQLIVTNPAQAFTIRKRT